MQRNNPIKYYFSNGSHVADSQDLKRYSSKFLTLYRVNGCDTNIYTGIKLADNTVVPVFSEDVFPDAQLYFFNEPGVCKIPTSSRVFYIAGEVFFERQLLHQTQLEKAYTRFNLLQMTDHQLHGLIIPKNRRVYLEGEKRFIIGENGKKIVVKPVAAEDDFISQIVCDKPIQTVVSEIHIEQKLKWTDWPEIKAKIEKTKENKKRRLQGKVLGEQAESKRLKKNEKAESSQGTSAESFDRSFFQSPSIEPNSLEAVYAAFYKPAV